MASLVVFLVASQVGLAREVSGGNPRSLNSQHQDGLVRAVSGDSHSPNLSSLSLHHSQFSQFSLSSLSSLSLFSRSLSLSSLSLPLSQSSLSSLYSLPPSQPVPQ